MEGGDKQKPHAIMVSFHLQGHIIPYVHLAIKLASHGFTVTFVHTHNVHRRISATSTAATDPFATARRDGLDIRYATINDGLPPEFDRDANIDRHVECILTDFPAYVDEFVGKMVELEPEAAFYLITDTFFVWPARVAAKYNLVNVSFWTEAALTFTLYYHLELLKENGHFASTENRMDIIDYIPGVEAVKPTDLMSYLQDKDISTMLHKIIFKAFDDVKQADFILCNTIEELESQTILAIQEKQPFYAIGPLFPTGFVKSPVAMSLWAESNCTHWLNARPNRSVLYVSFGSLVQTNKDIVTELARGLLISGVSFVWVIRPGMVRSDGGDVLPVGFREEIEGRGLILPWCCQIEVISNPAIGGFLTHCGWNSVLESIWSEVPMICFPLYTDQFTNRKLVVDDWKIGINLCNGKSVQKEEVAEKINLSMNEKTSIGLRKEIKKMKKTLEIALASEGSSEKNFNQFIQDLKIEIYKMR